MRTGHALRNLSTTRQFALTLLRQDQPHPKRSLRGRRKTADRLAHDRESLLGLQGWACRQLPCFEDVLGKHAADKLLRRVQFHHTPQHASWLNGAEIKIGILNRRCLDRRVASQEHLKAEVAAWPLDRNKDARATNWKFTRQDADEKLSHHPV